MGITGYFAFVPLHEAVSERSIVDGVAFQSVQPSGTQLCPTQSRKLHTALSCCGVARSEKHAVTTGVSTCKKPYSLQGSPRYSGQSRPHLRSMCSASNTIAGFQYCDTTVFVDQMSGCSQAGKASTHYHCVFPMTLLWA